MLHELIAVVHVEGTAYVVVQRSEWRSLGEPAGSAGTLWRLAACTAGGLLPLSLAVVEAPQAKSS